MGLHGGARRVGLPGIVRALGHELRGVAATVRHTRAFMWAMYGMVLLIAASVGALPLGWLALLLQVAGYLVVAMFVVFPGIIAYGIRADDTWEMRERDSADAVTYLPVVVALFAMPFYLLAQAVLFRRIFLQLPGILTGSTWGDATSGIGCVVSSRRCGCGSTARWSPILCWRPEFARASAESYLIRVRFTSMRGTEWYTSPVRC